MSEIIDCELLFDALKNKSKPHWVAAMILALDLSVDKKYKIGKLLLKTKDSWNWFMVNLYGDDNVD